MEKDLEKLSLEKNDPNTDLLLKTIYNNILKENPKIFSTTKRIWKFINLLNSATKLNPKFILKAASFLKSEFNLRYIPNMMLAYASIRRDTKEFLTDYFNSCIKSLQDILDIVEYCQILSVIDFKTGKFRNIELTDPNTGI